MLSADATARLSSFNLSNKTSNGGIKIGINAICTGTTFCEKQAIIAKENTSSNLLPRKNI